MIIIKWISRDLYPTSLSLFQCSATCFLVSLNLVFIFHLAKLYSVVFTFTVPDSSKLPWAVQLIIPTSFIFHLSNILFKV